MRALAAGSDRGILPYVFDQSGLLVTCRRSLFLCDLFLCGLRYGDRIPMGPVVSRSIRHTGFAIFTYPQIANTDAKASALILFVGLFLFGSNLPGAILLPLVAHEPHFARHVLGHFLAVTMSGLFASALLLSLQGILLNILGARLFRIISPILQGLALMVLLLVLFLTPLFSNYLEPLSNSGNKALLYFPPFWFLGIYERLLNGSSVLPIFHELARIGFWVTMIFIALAISSYPLAYKRKTRQVIEGASVPNTPNWFRSTTNSLLNHVYLLTPKQRAIYHFINQTLLRTAKHRVYLAAHAGLAFALVIAGVLAFQFKNGRITPVYSTYGLRSSIPILAFWLVSGFQTTLRSPVNVRASWIFTLIHDGPDPEYSAAIDRWVFMRIFFATVAVVLLAAVLSPETFLHSQQITIQLMIATSLSILLTKSFFQVFYSVPFSISANTARSNLPFVLLLYIVVFPPLVWGIAELGPWMTHSFGHVATMLLTTIVLLFVLDWRRRSAIKERAGWIRTENDEEDFQRLGIY
jgi:hypothetical protein